MTYQLWRHLTDDLVYVVQTDHRELFRAAGPLRFDELRAALEGDFDDDPEVRAALTEHPDQYRLMQGAGA